MRITLMVLTAFLFINGALAQDSVSLKSNFEKFSSRTGRMYRTDEGHVGEAKDFNVDLKRTTDLETGDTSKAVVIRRKVSGFLLGTITVGSLYIDYEEVFGVIRALEYYNKQTQGAVPTYEPYFEYSTSNDVTISCFYKESGDLKGWNIWMYKVYHNLKTMISNSAMTAKPKDLPNIIFMLKHSLEVNFK